MEIIALDSWDNESFNVYANEKEIISEKFGHKDVVKGENKICGKGKWPE